LKTSELKFNFEVFVQRSKEERGNAKTMEGMKLLVRLIAFQGKDLKKTWNPSFLPESRE